MSFINAVGVFVFYCTLGYIGLVVLYALFGVLKAIFIPSSRTYSRRRQNSSSNSDNFNPVYWDDSSHCNHSHDNSSDNNHD